MEIKRTSSYNPQFQAKLLITDARITNFFRQSNNFARIQTEAAERMLENQDKTTLIILNMAEKNGKHYIVARNPKTRAKESIEISNPNKVADKDRFAYLELINRLSNTTLNNIKKFWGIK